MAGVADKVREIVEPVLAARGLLVHDVEHSGASLRITVDREGGVDLGALSDASKVVSRLLDEHDPVPGRYTLEVSSPGLERPLRTPAHFERAVGSPVKVRTAVEVDGERRFEGVLEAADDEGITIAGRRLAYADIERARTVFEWGSAAPTGPRKSEKKAATR